MARFLDAYLPSSVLGYPAEVAPNFSTQIVVVDSGNEQVNQRWANPLRSISIPQGVRNQPTFEDLKSHWLVTAGPARTWPFRDPTDFASVELAKVNIVPAVTRIDQPLGLGDGSTVEFQLTKRYTVGLETYDRPIYFPVVSTVLIGVDGVDPSAASPPLSATVAREGGKVTFNNPPGLGAILTWGGLFDIQVRYESDDTFKGIMRTYGVSGFADIPLMEVRYCED